MTTLVKFDINTVISYIYDFSLSLYNLIKLISLIAVATGLF